MIFDNIRNIEQYKGLYSNLDVVIDFVKDNNLKQLPLGKTNIDDSNYVNIIMGNKIPEDEGTYELHKSFLDLHIDIEHSEKILFCNSEDDRIVKPYNSEEDYALLKGDCTSCCRIDKSHFVICMLDEPHMPCVQDESESGQVKKAIFKIKVK